MMRVLHVGCGDQPLPSWIGVEGKVAIKETRIDIDAECQPDIVASMTDLGDIGEFDVVYNCHALEHLYPHEVPKALSEFHRVLAKNGHAFVIVPDLEGLSFTEDVLYETHGHPVTAIDMIYGKRDLIQASPHMAHHCGFTASLLTDALQHAGFNHAQAHRAGNYNLMGVGKKE